MAVRPCGKFPLKSQRSEGSHPAIATEAQPRPGTEVLRRPVTRRRFLAWYLFGLLTAMVVAIVAPILVFIYPYQGASKKQDLKVTLDKALDELQEGDALKLEAPPNTGFVMIDGGGDNYPGAISFGAYAVKQVGGAVTVFAINCSHLGCSVAFNAGAARFDCPCHGSQFNLKGQVTHGPAAFPLSNVAWKKGAATNEILVGGVNLPGIG